MADFRVATPPAGASAADDLAQVAAFNELAHEQQARRRFHQARQRQNSSTGQGGGDASLSDEALTAGGIACYPTGQRLQRHRVPIPELAGTVH
jgi:hypothetical protein